MRITRYLASLWAGLRSPPVASGIPSWRVSATREHVASAGAFLFDSNQVAACLRAFGPDSSFDQAWQCSEICPKPYLAALKWAQVVPGTRLLLTATGRALSDEIDFAAKRFNLRPKRWEMELLAEGVLRFDPGPKGKMVIPAGIHLTGEHEANYFHWIVEILPRLFVCEQLKIDPQIPLLVTAGLHDNLYRLLDLVRHPERLVIRLEPGARYTVKRLIYPGEVTRILDTYDRAPGLDTVYLPVALLRALSTRIRDGAATGSQPGRRRRIFVRRGSGHRKLLNEAEIEAVLVERGFEAVSTELLTIAQQLALFREATVVVGASGAAMANLLWMRPGTRALILHSDHPFKKYPYWDAIARAAGVSLEFIAGPRAGVVQGLFEIHDDFTVPPSKLLGHLTT